MFGVEGLKFLRSVVASCSAPFEDLRNRMPAPVGAHAEARLPCEELV